MGVVGAAEKLLIDGVAVWGFGTEVFLSCINDMASVVESPDSCSCPRMGGVVNRLTRMQI